MKKIQLAAIVIFLALTTSPKANALVEVPTLRFGLGYAPLTFTAGTVFKEPTPLGNMMTINPMFLWDMPGIRTRLGVHFLADIGSKYGQVSIAGMGLTAIFYPLGLSSGREFREDFSEIVKTRVSPYFQVQITPAKMSVTKKPLPTDSNFSQEMANSVNWPYFSALVIETSFGIGVDYPIGNDLIIFGGLHYRAAAYKEQETTTGSISYSGMELLVGLMTNFY